MKTVNTLAFLWMVAGIGTAVPEALAAGSCEDSAAHAFDFWIGDWDIRQTILGRDGNLIELDAMTSVGPALDGCALVEHWRGEVQFFWEGMAAPAPMTGLSVRAYDPLSGQWRIHWMDSRSPRFGAPFEGGFVAGRGEFYRHTATPDGTRLDRITFSGITDRSVDWALALSQDNGENWQTLWTMHMVRRPAARE